MITVTPDCKGNILLGQQGENEARVVQFDISDWIEEFGEGEARVLVQRSGDVAPYLVSVNIEDDIASWVVSDIDTAIAGKGKVEVAYIIGTIVVKTIIYETIVNKSLGAETTPPDPWESWMDELLEIKDEIIQAQSNIEAIIQSFTPTSNGDYVIRSDDGVVSLVPVIWAGGNDF